MRTRCPSRGGHTGKMKWPSLLLLGLHANCRMEQLKPHTWWNFTLPTHMGRHWQSPPKVGMCRQPFKPLPDELGMCCRQRALSRPNGAAVDSVFGDQMPKTCYKPLWGEELEKHQPRRQDVMTIAPYLGQVQVSTSSQGRWGESVSLCLASLRCSAAFLFTAIHTQAAFSWEHPWNIQMGALLLPLPSCLGAISLPVWTTAKVKGPLLGSRNLPSSNICFIGQFLFQSLSQISSLFSERKQTREYLNTEIAISFLNTKRKEIPLFL